MLTIKECYDCYVGKGNTSPDEHCKYAAHSLHAEAMASTKRTGDLCCVIAK
jgi:hypothetical protein